MSARTARALAAALVLLPLAAAGPAPGDETRLQQYFSDRKQAAEASRAGDLEQAEALLIDAVALYPDIPGSYIRLARVQAATPSKHDLALTNLGAYARMGLVFDVEHDPALKVLTGHPEWPRIAAELKANAAPSGKMETVATIAGEADWIGEGLVHDGKGLLMSTVSGRSIVRLTGSGAEPFLQTDTDTGAIFGLAVDHKRSVLWAAEAWGEGVPGGVGSPKTGLLKVSLADGKILARLYLPEDGGKHQLGDVVVGPDGVVYASDATGGGVWRLKPGGLALEPLVAPGVMASPQGLALCAGGKALLVADYSTGLHRIDLKGGEPTHVLGFMSGTAGTDGLIAAPGVDFGTRNASPLPLAVVATQNGAAPQRVRLLRVSPDCTEIEDAWTLVANLPGVDDITLATVEGGRVVFVGHSRWEARGDDLKLARPDPGPIRVFSTPLPDSPH